MIPDGHGHLRPAVRLDARPRARAQRRPHRDRRLPRQGPSFDRAIVEFSRAYAEQNERDYKALAEAVKSGRITAETGL